jgi:hypothetical protein
MKIHTALVAFVLVSSPLTLTTAIDSLSEGVHELEQTYIADCQADNTLHGFYGAFLQPCEFSFYESLSNEDSQGDACSNDISKLVGQPIPVHWFFKLSEHIEKDDWDSLSSDDMPDFDDLMLWPDQCVGVAPRCYQLGKDEIITDTLNGLFPDGTPEEATHVRVDCRADAMELSRVAYGFASGAEKSLPTIVAWMVTVLVLFLVAMSFCCYGCLRLCFCSTRNEDYHSYDMVPGTLVDEEHSRDGFHDTEK